MAGIKGNRKANLLLKAIIFLLFISTSYSQTLWEGPPGISLAEILSNADSVAKIEDSIRTETKIRYRLFSVMNRIHSDGTLKSSDTTIALITQKGDEEISREIISSTRSGAGEGKKGEKELSLSFDDPAYNFSLTDSSESSYKISVVPKSSPPKEGEYAGTIEIDKQRFFIRRFNLEVPDPEGALKEFAIEMDFELLEGGFAVPIGMRMRGYVKALIGIIRVRFTGEFRFSDYQILD